jgi:hypothetical protein
MVMVGDMLRFVLQKIILATMWLVSGWGRQIQDGKNRQEGFAVSQVRNDGGFG